MSTEPVMLAIVGDSAAGKTTLTEGIVRLLGNDRVAVICTDDYHRYDRAQRARAGHHAARPRVQLHGRHGAASARCSRRGEPILKPVYDH